MYFAFEMVARVPRQPGTTEIWSAILIKPYGYFYMDRACKEKQDVRRLSIEIGITPEFEGDLTGDASYECQFALKACDSLAPNLTSIYEERGRSSRWIECYLQGRG